STPRRSDSSYISRSPSTGGDRFRPQESGKPSNPLGHSRGEWCRTPASSFQRIPDYGLRERQERGRYRRRLGGNFSFALCPPTEHATPRAGERMVQEDTMLASFKFDKQTQNTGTHNHISNVLRLSDRCATCVDTTNSDATA